MEPDIVKGVEVVAFSGESRLYGPEEEEYVRDVVRRCKAELYVTGGAHGVDSLAAEAAVDAHPEAEHLVVYPAAPWNKALRKILPASVSFVEGPEGKDWPDSYMRRNAELAERADVLVAFPRSRKEALRSGTWATVRRARDLGVPVEIWPLEEAEE